MSLKELLGEELYNQVIEKAGDNKIAIVSDGNWIPKNKFDAKMNEVKDLQKQIDDRDEELEELKKVDPDELQQTITDLQEKYDTQKEEYEQKLQQQAFEHKLHDVLKDSGVRNVKAVKAVLDTENIKLDSETLLGLDDQLKGMQESNTNLFAQNYKQEEQKPNFTQGIHSKNGGESGFGDILLGKN